MDREAVFDELKTWIAIKDSIERIYAFANRSDENRAKLLYILRDEFDPTIDSEDELLTSVVEELARRGEVAPHEALAECLDFFVVLEAKLRKQKKKRVFLKSR